MTKQEALKQAAEAITKADAQLTEAKKALSNASSTYKKAQKARTDALNLHFAASNMPDAPAPGKK